MTTTVEKDILVQASRDDVWAQLADLKAIQVWAPPVATTTIDGAPGLGALRNCTFVGGGAITERITEWDPGAGFAYAITGDAPPGTQVSWTLAEEGPGVRIRCRTTFEHAPGAPPHEVIDAFGDTSEVLLAAFKHYVEKGTALEVPAEVDA